MHRVVAWMQAFALAFGAPGLFLSAFLDSSFISLPEVNDLLLVWMTTEHKSRMLLYASSATAGSIAGCLVLYYIGRRGAGLADKFGAARVERTLAAFRRYGVMAVLIPAMLPPPAPFKIFVLLAGVADISVGRFVMALLLGRGLRYFGEGFLALQYGDSAIEYLRANGGQLSLAVGVLLACGLAGYLLWSKTQGRTAR